MNKKLLHCSNFDFEDDADSIPEWRALPMGLHRLFDNGAWREMTWRSDIERGHVYKFI